MRTELTPALQKSEGVRVKTHTETFKIRQVIPQSGSVKGEAVLDYRNPLTTQDLKSSGFPRCFQGQQQGKIDPILRLHKWGYPRTIAPSTLLFTITVH